MNPPTTATGSIRVDLQKKVKRSLIKYSRLNGIPMTRVVEALIIGFLDNQIDIELMTASKKKGSL